MKNNLTHSVLLLVAFLILTSVSVSAQKVEANPAADLDQCRNGSVGSEVGCISEDGNTGWGNGNAGAENSHWAEDQFLVYRMRFSNLTNTSHTVVIGYDILKSGTHAIDYLGPYNDTETTADPCAGVSGCTLGSPSDTIAIPKDTVTVHGKINPNTGLPIVQKDGVFTMWGGDITAVSYVTWGGGEDRQIAVTFTSTVSNPVLAWGGHIAWVGDWGPNNSAGSIGGSPYHMRLISLDGSGGNQDRSLKTDAVIPSGAVIVIKDVQTLDNQDQADVFFDFQASAYFNPLTFQLKDVNDNIQDRKSSLAITTFGPANAITITEGPAAGFDLLDVLCSESGGASVADSTGSVGTRSATAIVQFGEVITCTFVNGTSRPTADPADVSGRVTDSSGRGISGARLTVFNVITGEARYASSNTFGYYKFTGLQTGEFYIMSVEHKRYLFLTPSISFSLEDNISGLNFQASK